MALPGQVDVWVGLDVGKEQHFAEVLDDAGARLFASGVANDQAALEQLLGRASEHGSPALVIDQPGSIAQLAIVVARARDVPVAYVPGLVMRRAADLYPGESKTDRRDAFVIADTARAWRRQVHWLDATSDEALEKLAVLNGFDVDLGADQTRQANRLRDLLVSVSPVLERVLGPPEPGRGTGPAGQVPHTDRTAGRRASASRPGAQSTFSAAGPGTDR